MTRLRRLAFRSWLMPLLVAAMACRALAPAGFMTAAGGQSPLIATTLCSLDKDRRESLQFPAEQQHPPRCDHCLNAPMGWAPIASLPLDLRLFAPPLIAPPATTPVPHSPLARSQTARAPPAA